MTPTPSDGPTLEQATAALSHSQAAHGIAPIRENAGARIGPYRLVKLLGEGGFGSVFMAEQEEPVRRSVALKIIKLGMDTHQVVARFEQERQALAILDHPNIAKVFDAGATDTGRPYFVMELCTGEPIDSYCDKHGLSVPARLELFEQVCAAVQHAHTKGVIHRDIKPSNVLVADQDGHPAAKVIDFGIAKATDAKLTEKTVFTQQRQIIGTPAYMSPEQAEGSLDIDTRTDVYSLGVLLYELLTGSTPFSTATLHSAAYAEIQRVIREVDPPRPSTRLGQNADSLPSIAAMRCTEPRKLGSILRGELDWIVMKALEKDRSRRYETANGLLMDIHRYLNGDAVLAAPASKAYRFRKFVRRNRPAVIAASGVAAALVLGLAGTIWQARIASTQRDLAHTEAARADERATAAVVAEAETRKRAEELQRVASFQGEMLSQVDPTTAGIRLGEGVRARYSAALTKAGVPEDERSTQLESFIGQWSRVNATDTAIELIDRTILKPAAATIDNKFADQPAVAAALRHALAERYYSLGLHAAAVALQEQALAARRRVLGGDHKETLSSISNMASFLAALGKRAEAEPYYLEALERSRRVLGDDDPQTITCILNLGVHFATTQRLTDAEPLLREALDRRRRILGEDEENTLEAFNAWANLLRDQGKLAESEQINRDVLAKRRKALGEDHFDTLRSLNDLGGILQVQGKVEESIEYFRQACEGKRRVLGEVHPSTLTSIQNLGTMLNQAGHPAEAEALMREALTKQRELLGPDHSSALAALGNLSVYLLGRDKFAEAEQLARETLERRTRVLGPNHAGTLVANNVMGLVLIRQGKPDEGEPYWRQALATAQRVLGPAHPDTLTYTYNLSGLALDRKDAPEAERLCREILEKGTPTIGAGHPIVLNATRRLGDIMVEQRRYDEAEELLSGAERAARKVLKGPTERFLAEFLKNLGLAQAGLNDFAAAETTLLEAHTIANKVMGTAHGDTRECAQALVDLYAGWDKAEPGKGHDTKAPEWKAKLDEAK